MNMCQRLLGSLLFGPVELFSNGKVLQLITSRVLVI
ncbi:hypothetical protein SAMN05216387_103350 [Nitrosovibrio tenuis]|uniref:Uncharacterized protein n=1 Tax=Nitrosovibrio tenuis TaxID=1233 RepID=A0A1H7KV65_9PROT|nr:hypothetical protein SAMN05216387_103350 [Nitrosovibrio tenuis]